MENIISLALSSKVKTRIPYDPENLLLGIYPRAEVFTAWSMDPWRSPGSFQEIFNVNTIPGGIVLKNVPANAGDSRDLSSVPSSQEDPLEKEMVTYFSILAWEIPWTEKPGEP